MGDAEMTEFMTAQGLVRGEVDVALSNWASSGYKIQSLSIYGTTLYPSPLYAVVVIRTSVAQRFFTYLFAESMQEVFDAQAAEGWGPVIITATGSSDLPVFAAVFERQDPIPYTRWGLTSGDVNDPNTIQGVGFHTRARYLIPTWAASYGTPGDERFAGIWIPNGPKTLYNNDGILDDIGTFNQRTEAQTRAWNRLAFVTMNASGQFFSIYRADSIGAWSKEVIDGPNLQRTIDSYQAQGMYPICLQGSVSPGGPQIPSFVAIFATTDVPAIKRFTSMGTTSKPPIDQVIEDTMGAYIRDAAIAIVHQSRLVYARGYSWVDPDWPTVSPTTPFRLASTSKTFTALAIFQLIQSNVLKLTDTLQSILNLKTPSGAPPTDVSFATITIQQLLEHKSGIVPGACSDVNSIVAAFVKAGLPATYPDTQQMIDAYIASLDLASPPGVDQVYSNTGYYLLSRVVAHLREVGVPFDSYLRTICEPLTMLNTQISKDLVWDVPANEARYQAVGLDSADPDLPVVSSLMAADHPLVAAGYGDGSLEVTQGAGGISSAAVDVARLVAVLMSGKDSPILQWATLQSMLQKAAALASIGYGLDFTYQYPNGTFYGQKGGLIANAASVLQFDGDWGLVALWGARAQELRTPSWYPNYTAMMNVAKPLVAGSPDLFPMFGMPSL
jgi:CubicO group peptidase (beta-lactamase class C family)